MEVRVIVTVLSEAQLDSFKLAMLDLGSAKPGYNSPNSWLFADPKKIGCIFAAFVVMEVTDPSPFDQTLDKILRTLDKRMQYLSCVVQFGNFTRTRHGNIDRQRSSEGPYRDMAGDMAVALSKIQ